jgi:endo-1,4-beta-mannosidase
MPQPFTLGVNYWPRRKAMYWWSDFDAGEVRDEFALLHDLGLSLVRLFLLWEDWQPTPEAVSPECLKNLATVCDIAADLDLRLDVTFFTGHMSGPNWSPGWLRESAPPHDGRWLVSGRRYVEGGCRNQFTDPVALQAERLLLRTVVGALKDHPAIGIWNLGNEPDLFAWPPDAATGRAWVREMAGLIHGLDAQHLVTCGLHIASLLQDNHLHVDQVFAETDLAVMHAYPMYLHWARDPLDPEVVPFSCALTSALCGKPTLMEEFGGCTTPEGGPSQTWEWTGYGEPRQQFMASEEALAEYLTAVLPKLVEVGATGALVWCFADYAPELWDRPPCDQSQHERHFGLVRPDGTLKPHAHALRRFAESRPAIAPAAKTVTLPFSPDEFYRDPARHTVELYRQYLA